MQEGIGVQDENGIVTYVNPRFCQMLGLSIEEAVGRHVNTFFDDNNKQIVQYQMSKRKEDKNIPYEIDWLHKNGENIPTIMSPRAIIDENGNFKGSFGVLTEITELKKYQKALVESKLWMDSIYHALTESVIVLNMERELMDVNSATLSMFGYSMKELRGVSVEIFHIDHDHHLECGLLIKEYLSNSEKAKFEYKVKRKSGEIFTVEYSISKLKNAKGEQIGVVESIRDITKRKIVEEKVVKSVNDFKEAQKIAQVGSWELNLTDNSLKWSDQIYRIFNLKPQVFEATYEAFLNNIHPDDRDTVNKAYSNSLVTKKPYEITHRLKLKNGNIKYVREMCKTDFDDNGKPLRSIGTVQDITAIKLAEIELEKYKDNLEKIVYEATEELEIKNNKLRDSYLIEKANKNKLEETYSKLKKAQYQMVESEKMASLGQFTAGIAHEINNPINFIGVGIASLDENIIEVINVLEKYNQVNTENVSKKLTEINNYKKEIQFDSLLKFIQKNTINVKNGVRRTSEIIDGLRIFSRTDQDKTSIIDVHKSLDATLVILHNQYTSKNIDIVTDYGKIPKIECFQGKLNQVFTNLIMNSIHAIEDQNNPKKGVITIATKPLNNNEIAISFKDNGKGIPSDIKGKIFDPFFTSKEIGKGTGLGLSISYGIIKMHNGKIKVSSKEGKGTEFEIILPKKYSNPEG